MTRPYPLLQEHVYLYSLLNGRFTVHEGRVYEYHKRGSFKSKTKSLGCAAEEGIVYNSMVWLKERDDARAKEILIAYAESAIVLLQERINNHLSKIELLKGE